jgi:hypothetical protein
VAPDDALFDESDDVIVDRFVDALTRVHPRLRRDDVVAARVSRVRNVFAMPTVGFVDRLPPRETSRSRVHLASSANISNGTLNVDETVALAEEVARDLLAAGGGSGLAPRTVDHAV